jgi:hypothetical protein
MRHPVGYSECLRKHAELWRLSRGLSRIRGQTQNNIDSSRIFIRFSDFALQKLIHL